MDDGSHLVMIRSMPLSRKAHFVTRSAFDGGILSELVIAVSSVWVVGRQVSLSRL